MKKLILFITLFSFICCYSQTVFSHSYIGAPSVEILESGKIVVEGSKDKAIEDLIKVIENMQQEREDAMDSVLKSVEWSNTVPDYWKKNKQWYLYLNAIKLQGFKFEKKPIK